MPCVTNVTVTDDRLAVQLADGRCMAAPLAWYPRLVHATPAERDNWELHAAGQHIHWPDLDEDLSVDGLLAGRRSQESRASLERWMAARGAGRGVTLPEIRDPAT